MSDKIFGWPAVPIGTLLRELRNNEGRQGKQMEGDFAKIYQGGKFSLQFGAGDEVSRAVDFAKEFLDDEEGNPLGRLAHVLLEIKYNYTWTRKREENIKKLKQYICLLKNIVKKIDDKELKKSDLIQHIERIRNLGGDVFYSVGSLAGFDTKRLLKECRKVHTQFYGKEDASWYRRIRE